MNYSSFVKNYYTYVMNKIKTLSSYNGSMAMISEPLNVPNEYLVVNQNVNNYFSPSQIVAIDAPANYMEEFLEYYCKMQPDLSILYAGKDGLRKLFSLMASKNIGEGEEDEFISLLVDFFIEGLKREGILG